MGLKTVKDVRSLMEKASRLAAVAGDMVYGESAIEVYGSVKEASSQSRSAANMLSVYAPILDQADWTSGTEYMAANHRKRFEATAKIAACRVMQNALMQNGTHIQSEAALAGLDVPAFTRQLLLTITRAYAQLFTLQLFRVIPMTGPTARIHFRDTLYDSAYAGSTPTINPGDRTDDLTKFNPGFFQTPEGVNANLIKSTYKKFNVSELPYRVAEEWSEMMAEDVRSQYDEDYDAINSNHLVQEMTRVTDWTMLKATHDAVIAANVNYQTWTAKPDGTNGTQNYAAMTPSEQREYNATFYSDGIQPLVSKIRKTRQYANDGEPQWGICGTSIPDQLAKTSLYQMIQSNAELDVKVGAMRDIGELKGLGIRLMVSPMLDNMVSNGANKIVFGRRQTDRMSPGIDYLPYVGITTTKELFYPRSGMTEKAVRTRFAIGKPDTVAEPASVQLGHIYGVLEVT